MRGAGAAQEAAILDDVSPGGARARVSDREPAVQVRELTRSYGSRQVVRDVSFTVPAGGIFCLVGPNGAGKTTTIEILEGLRTPTSGAIDIFGIDAIANRNALKSRIGVLPQELELETRLTARENLAYYASLYDRRADVDDLIDRLGLASCANQRFGKLSGGQKRRVGIAAALVNDPDLVFLDEPTSGADPLARRELWTLLRGLQAKGTTIFFTTHYMDEAERLADVVCVINDGRIVAGGKPAELVQTLGASKRLVLRNLTPDAMAIAMAKGFQRGVEPGEATRAVEDAHLAEAMRDVQALGFPSRDISVRQPSLDDVFIALVEGGVTA